MISQIVSALTSIVGAVGTFLTPTAGDSSTALLNSAGVAAIGALFSIPVAIAAGRKAIGLVKSIKG